MLPLALELARIAQVDEHDVVAAVQLQRVGGRNGLDLGVRLVDQSLVAAGDRLGHASLFGGQREPGRGSRMRSTGGAR